MPEKPAGLQAKDLSPWAQQELRQHVEQFRTALQKRENEVPVLDLTPLLIDLFRLPFNNIPLTAEAVRKSGITELLSDYQNDILGAVIDAQLLQGIDPTKPGITFTEKHFVILDEKPQEVRLQVNWLEIQRQANEFHEKYASSPFPLDAELYLKALNDVWAKMPKNS